MVKRKKKIIEMLCRYGVSPLCCVLGWELAVRGGLLSDTFFPPPTAIFFRLCTLLFSDRAFLQDCYWSVYRLCVGSFIAIPLGVAVGGAIGFHKKIDYILSPLVAFLYPLPKLVLLPLLMIMLGIGDAPKVAIVVIGVFFHVLLAVVHGVKGFASQYFEMVTVFKIPFWKRVTQVYLKGLFPDILNGCKVGVGYGLVMVVAGEFIAAKNGVGFFMWNAWDQFRIIDMYVGLFVFALAGLGVFVFFDSVRYGLKWSLHRNAQ